jgi:hypothetical protein
MVQGVSSWMASGRQVRVSLMASKINPSGSSLRARSTMYPPMMSPGAMLPWNDLARCM